MIFCNYCLLKTSKHSQKLHSKTTILLKPQFFQNFVDLVSVPKDPLLSQRTFNESHSRNLLRWPQLASEQLTVLQLLPAVWLQQLHHHWCRKIYQERNKLEEKFKKRDEIKTQLRRGKKQVYPLLSWYIENYWQLLLQVRREKFRMKKSTWVSGVSIKQISSRY